MLTKSYKWWLKDFNYGMWLYKYNKKQLQEAQLYICVMTNQHNNFLVLLLFFMNIYIFVPAWPVLSSTATWCMHQGREKN